MPDHFHALITPVASLERAVQFIKGGFSHRAKLELESNMEVWQKGFSDHRIRDAEDYSRHVEYIHQNPVGKHLCEVPGEYAYSSAGGRFSLDEVPQRLKPYSESAGYGAPEGAPLQRNWISTGGAAAAPPEARPDCIGATEADAILRGLKPPRDDNRENLPNGAPEGAPLQGNAGLEGAGVQRKPSSNGAAKAAPLQRAKKTGAA